ncbi:hypothetical protein U9M48_021206 [Paspalum notatum var. saurae]|uniref:CTP synthase n=1 Tax=Paspalum notatum var. saurae TaxID=547442 RepID=A0AAQ3WTP0_PASNO
MAASSSWSPSVVGSDLKRSEDRRGPCSPAVVPLPIQLQLLLLLPITYRNLEKMKYVVVTSGVVSGLGNGVAASSIGVVLKASGLRVTFIKIGKLFTCLPEHTIHMDRCTALRFTLPRKDPYLNTDARTMSPSERGEVFVLDDGSEVDMDLGNYERFLDVELTGDNKITTGKIYQALILSFSLQPDNVCKLVIRFLRCGVSFTPCMTLAACDRQGEKRRLSRENSTGLSVVPHVTDAIQEWIERVALMPVDGIEGQPDVCIVELGGTTGDIESRPFIEALSQFSYRSGNIFGGACLVPLIDIVGEQKTKPTQFSVQNLRELGLTPNLLACRSATPLNKNVKQKLSQFCHVPVECIVSLTNVPNIWHVPSLLIDQKGHEAILGVLGLSRLAMEPKLDTWMNIARTCHKLHAPVRIAVVGKCTNVSNAYHSILEAMLHASVACHRRLSVDWVPASDLDEETSDESPDLHEKAWSLLKGADGVLVPGGFGGHQGVGGEILAAKYARENNVPYLGICLGMQVAVIEFARSVLGLKDANSTEFDAGTRHPCLVAMPEACLGSRRTYFRTVDCKSAKLYGNVKYVDERHRHRYEVNPEMVGELESAGVKFVGTDEAENRMEVLELPWHPYFVGVQFHPELKSRPGKPSPLFMGLIAAASSGLLDDGSMLQSPAGGVENGHGSGPVPIKVVSRSSGSGYASGGGLDLEEGVLGVHVSGAALAH